MRCAFPTKAGKQCRNAAAHLVGRNADIPICAQHWRKLVVKDRRDTRTLVPQRRKT